MYYPWIITYSRPNWKRVAFTAVLAYCIALGLRLLEVPGWGQPLFLLDGEYLLATHDAYHWAAGAIGFEFGAGHPMSLLIAAVSSITGLSAGDATFWLAPFLASLVAPIVVVWAAVFGVRSGGAVAGVLASLAPAFLGRTLLGFGDTDLITLLFSLLLGLVPAIWLAPWLRSPAAMILRYFGFGARSFKLTDQAQSRGASLSRAWLVALFLAGCFGWWGQDWHSLFPYLVRGYAGILPFLIIFLAQRNARVSLLLGTLVYALPMVGGAPGAVCGAVLALILSQTPKFAGTYLSRRMVLILLWGIVFAFMVDATVFHTFTKAIGSYLKTEADIMGSGNAATPLAYPAAAQSIVETQDLGFTEVLNYLHPWLVVSILGVLGFILLLFITPTATLHLPLVALAFLGMKLGGRMVMFGAASVTLGFAVPICWITQKLLTRYIPSFSSGSGKALAHVLPEVILCIFLIPYGYLIPQLTQGPILDVEHARALRALNAATPSNSVVWDWWDFGYAAHYFAQRQTLADGARHAAGHLYLPALVYTTDNPRLAAQIMREAAGKESPNDVLKGMGAAEAMAYLEELGREDKDIPIGRPQYLVVSFDLLRLAYWVSLYGTWDFTKRTGTGYSVGNLTQSIKFLLKNGTVMAEGMPPVLADSINLITNSTVTGQSYMRFNNRHFIFNAMRGDKLVMDDQLYNSLMVQLLICPPDDPRFTPYFRLIYDSPLCRVYEVKQPEPAKEQNASAPVQ